MYIIEFVNAVRQAQGYESIDQLPREGDSGRQPARAGDGLQAGTRPDAALIAGRRAGRRASPPGQPLGFDGFTVALPGALSGHAGELDRRRARLEPGTYDGHGDATRAAL